MIQLELKPEVEARLVQEAETLGVEVHAYAERLLEEAVTPKVALRNRTSAEMAAFFDAMAAYSDKIPLLPDSALTREGLYQDHD